MPTEGSSPFSKNNFNKQWPKSQDGFEGKIYHLQLFFDKPHLVKPEGVARHCQVCLPAEYISVET